MSVNLDTCPLAQLLSNMSSPMKQHKPCLSECLPVLQIDGRCGSKHCLCCCHTCHLWSIAAWADICSNMICDASLGYSCSAWSIPGHARPEFCASTGQNMSPFQNTTYYGPLGWAYKSNRWIMFQCFLQRSRPLPHMHQSVTSLARVTAPAVAAPVPYTA